MQYDEIGRTIAKSKIQRNLTFAAGSYEWLIKVFCNKMRLVKNGCSYFQFKYSITFSFAAIFLQTHEK